MNKWELYQVLEDAQCRILDQMDDDDPIPPIVKRLDEAMVAVVTNSVEFPDDTYSLDA